MLFWGYRLMRPAPLCEVLRQEERPAFGVVLELVALQEPIPFLYNFLVFSGCLLAHFLTYLVWLFRFAHTSVLQFDFFVNVCQPESML